MCLNTCCGGEKKVFTLFMLSEAKNIYAIYVIISGLLRFGVTAFSPRLHGCHGAHETSRIKYGQ
jgi:hypothetical protein